MTPLDAQDRAHLTRALALSVGVGNAAHPNPAVGCVIVDERGEVAGEGVSAPAGGPHAEVFALAAAGLRAGRGTAYVSLEPCAHHGRTPPCTDALARAGLERVVFAVADPHHLAAGGAARLAAGGVEVRGPLPADDPLAAATAGHLEGFLHVVRHGRPHVTLKLAQTADGRLTSPDAEAGWITGPAARRAVHRWRAAADAVLVGSGTVLADDPQLDVRHVPAAVQPRPVVLDARLRVPPDARCVRPGAVVVTVVGSDPARRARLEAAGAEVVEVAAARTDADATAAAHGVDLLAALERLATSGVTRVFAEPGATLAEALLAADLVDRVVLHIAPQLGDGPPRRAVLAHTDGRWRTERAGGAGGDLVLHLARLPREAQRRADDTEAA